jgi:hypothetical protein
MKRIYLDYCKENNLWEVKIVRDFIIFEYVIEKFGFTKIQAAIKKIKQLDTKYY